ncbi:hypothetical protein ACJ41O_009144 [Fusarium nematophilum]
MRRHLLLVNVIIIILDIPILVLEYVDLYDFQTAYKAIVYSIKLKLEFNILNRLVEMTHGNDPSGLRNQGLGTDTATTIHMNTFGDGVSGGNITSRGYAHSGEHSGAKSGKAGKPRTDNESKRSMEITVHHFEPGVNDNESIERRGAIQVVF